jgi:hypothetical protein
MRRINQRRVKGVADWTREHTPYIALWNVRESRCQFYLHGAQHRSGLWKEYLRWLHQQAWLFLRPAYTDEDIAQLSDSDGDNEIVDEYDEMTRHIIIQPEHGPFQNYVVSMFLYFYCVLMLKFKFLIVTNVVQAMQFRRFANDAGDTLSHPPNSTVPHNALRAFITTSGWHLLWAITDNGIG